MTTNVDFSNSEDNQIDLRLNELGMFYHPYTNYSIIDRYCKLVYNL